MNWSPRPHRWLAPLALIASVVFTDSLCAQYESGERTETAPAPRAPEFTAFPRVWIFFPPQPPPLGAQVPRPPAFRDARSAPAELAEFVNELFYPQLSAQLYAKTLSKKLRDELTSYRSAKQELRSQLQAELERVRDHEPDARAQELAALARIQAPALADLEATAENLRRDLIRSEQGWSAQRDWRLGNNVSPAYSPTEIAMVMQAHAFYLNGLLPAQRRLLREIAFELKIAADSAAKATAAQPHVFFPPEPARVAFPDDLPADVAAKIAAYETKKSRLKKELFEAIFELDGAKLGFITGNTAKALANRQVAPLRELDLQAEEIRREVAHLAYRVPAIERSPLSPTLANRAEVMMKRFATIQTNALAKANVALQAARDLPIRASAQIVPDGLKFTLIPSRTRTPPDPKTLSAIAELRTNLTEIADDYGQRLAELINEKDAIRAEIAATLGNAQATVVDNALITALRAPIQKELNELHRDYRIAVFQPGLSPEQRRLLFDGVVEQLDLPLPRGELQPTTRTSRW
jgi:hypothetical protein